MALPEYKPIQDEDVLEDAFMRAEGRNSTSRTPGRMTSTIYSTMAVSLITNVLLLTLYFFSDPQTRVSGKSSFGILIFGFLHQMTDV